MSASKSTRLPPDGKREICRHFLRNACDYGSKCCNIHARPVRAPAWSSGSMAPHFPPLSRHLATNGQSALSDECADKKDVDKKDGGKESKSRVTESVHPPCASSSTMSSASTASTPKERDVSTGRPVRSGSSKEDSGDIGQAGVSRAQGNDQDSGRASAGQRSDSRDKTTGRVRCRYYLRKHLVCKNGDGCRFYHDPEFERAAAKLRVYECACGQFSPKSSCADCYAQLKAPNLRLPCRHAAFGCRHRVKLAGGSCTKCYDNRAVQCAGCQYDSGRDPTVPSLPPSSSPPPPPPQSDSSGSDAPGMTTASPTLATPVNIAHSSIAPAFVPLVTSQAPHLSPPPPLTSHYVSSYPPPGFFVVPASGHIHMSEPSSAYDVGAYAVGSHQDFGRAEDDRDDRQGTEPPYYDASDATAQQSRSRSDAKNGETGGEDGNGGGGGGDDRSAKSHANRGDFDGAPDSDWRAVASYHEMHNVAHYVPPSYMTHASVAAASGLFAPFRSMYRAQNRGVDRYSRAAPDHAEEADHDAAVDMRGDYPRHASTLYRGAHAQPRMCAPHNVHNMIVHDVRNVIAHDVRNVIAKRHPSAPPPSQESSPNLSAHSLPFCTPHTHSFADELLLDQRAHAADKKDDQVGGGQGRSDGVSDAAVTAPVSADEGDYMPLPADKGPARVTRYGGPGQPAHGLSTRLELSGATSVVVATTTTTTVARADEPPTHEAVGSDTNTRAKRKLETSKAQYVSGAGTDDGLASDSPDPGAVPSVDTLALSDVPSSPHASLCASPKCDRPHRTAASHGTKGDEKYASAFSTFLAADSTTLLDSPRTLKCNGMLPETLQIASSLTSPSAASAPTTPVSSTLSPTLAPTTSHSASSTTFVPHIATPTSAQTKSRTVSL